MQTTSNLFRFFSFSLLWILENILLLFFYSFLSSDLVMFLSVLLSVLSVLNNLLSSLFLFNLFLCVCFLLSFLFSLLFFSTLFFGLGSVLSISPFFYFLVSFVVSFCLSNLLSFFSFPITLFFLLVHFVLFLFNLF